MMLMSLQFYPFYHQHYASFSNTMNFFKSVQNFQNILGIYPPHSPNQSRTLNLRNFFFLVPTIALHVSGLCFFIFKSSSVLDRAESLYVILTHLASTLVYLVSYWKIETILMLIKRLNEYIEKSKF